MNDAFREDCPCCGAKAGKPCVYVAVVGVDPQFAHYRSAKVQARLARVGQPTARPHLARQARADDRADRAARKAARTAVIPVSAQHLAAARALRQFDLDEYQQLRAWLAAHARLLTDLDTG